MSNSGESLFWAVCETCLGWVGAVGSPAGLKSVVLPQKSRKAVLKCVASVGCKPESYRSDYLASLLERLQRYFEGETVNFPDRLDLTGTTDFQRRVWRLVSQIPRGETRSYGWVANRIGSPNSARAVGQALARNPVPIVIPCHRVISEDGKLGGFGGGLKLKKFLLALEQHV